MVKMLKVLRRSRTGKKSSITKRIQQLDRLVSEKGGRRAIGLLLEGLQKVFGELEQVCEEIFNLSDVEDELNDIEDIRFEVDGCVASTTDHLELRKDDPPSEDSSIALSWVRKHAGRFGVISDDGSNHSSEDGNAVGGKDLQESEAEPIHQTGKRFNYSESRPATPRTLPRLPPAPILRVPVVSDANVQLDDHATLGEQVQEVAAAAESVEALEHTAREEIPDAEGVKLPLSEYFTGDGDVQGKSPF